MLAAQDFSDKPATVAGVPHNLLDGRAAFESGGDVGVDFFAPQIALVLKPLRGGEQRRIDMRRAQRRAYLAHRFAHGAEEGGAGVLHEMPAIGNLEGVGKRPAGGERKAAAAVSGDNSDLRLSSEPRLGGRRLPVGKEFDRATALEINRSVTLVALPGPVVDPDDVRRWRRRPACSPHHAQQSVVADRHHEAPRQARCRSATERERQMMDETVEARSSTSVGRENVVTEPFSKNASTT